MDEMKRSIELFEKAKNFIPGGVSSPVRAIKPYPFYTKSAHGSRIMDVDGNEYIDYCMGYGPLILGHSYPAIKEALKRQLDDGWLYGTPCELEVELSEKINRYFPAIEMMRFVNTGTEATMAAIRVARGFTGLDKFIKIEGGFHGAHDACLVKAGSGATTHGVPDSLGVPRDFTKNTLQVPYNDIESLVSLIEANKGEIAALIMEPVLGNIGTITPEKGYLEEVRAVTAENDILLIFDEVITGFRLAMGGAQEYFGVKPDMTTLGKVIGGGIPIGVVGGRRDIMENVSPQGKVYQAGTFNGNPLSLAAGIATIETLVKEDVHRVINARGERLRNALAEIIHDAGLDYAVGGIGSMFIVFFGELPSNYTEALKCDKEGYFKFFGRMLKHGIFLPPSQFETNFISFAHSEEDIDTTIATFGDELAV
ncbi:MAG: glutamate-1-semialdehyde aminotransferase [Candidatus Syntrophoarchaeum caldarius]|uniref:Glutamate-1-semialdehyde 2,1-aminomutase n=1 Tax=Candidatus Syntropharchaeum caldarium TaxID=1838285 RepID=A0A1F2PAQ8_9EURY|nr:MAG: glutamate-1-semialdehyde aminotransferase [Candidatus Syntrophoarchaeum caldarius]